MKDIVIFVHGTGDVSAEDGGERWWQHGSAFHRFISEQLNEHFEVNPAGQVFHWTGLNSERERRRAARKLSSILLSFERAKQPYHLIGHSHGGSVMWLAMIYAAQKKPSLQHLCSWTTVGTPFLQYRPRISRFWLVLPFAVSIWCLLTLWRNLPDYLEVLPHIREVGTGPIVLLAALWLLIAVTACLLGFALASLLYALYRTGQQSTRSEHVWRDMAGRYFGIWSDADEAINGLSRTLEFGDQLNDSAQEARQHTWISRCLAPLSALYRATFKRELDRFIWEYVTRRLQGSDLLPYELFAVTTRPVRGFEGWPTLPASLNAELLESANLRAGTTVAALRDIIGLASESDRGCPKLFTGLRNSLTWAELVHTSYFDHQLILRLVITHVLASKTGYEPNVTENVWRWYAKEKDRLLTVSAVPALQNWSPSEPHSRIKYVLLSLLIWGLSGASDVLHRSAITPFTDRYQFQNAVNDAGLQLAAADSSGVDGIERANEWIVELVRAAFVKLALVS